MASQFFALILDFPPQLSSLPAIPIIPPYPALIMTRSCTVTEISVSNSPHSDLFTWLWQLLPVQLLQNLNRPQFFALSQWTFSMSLFPPFFNFFFTYCQWLSYYFHANTPKSFVSPLLYTLEKKSHHLLNPAI